jgi:hypothetical protein
MFGTKYPNDITWTCAIVHPPFEFKILHIRALMCQQYVFYARIDGAYLVLLRFVECHPSNGFGASAAPTVPTSTGAGRGAIIICNWGNGDNESAAHM